MTARRSGNASKPAQVGSQYFMRSAAPFDKGAALGTQLHLPRLKVLGAFGLNAVSPALKLTFDPDIQGSPLYDAIALRAGHKCPSRVHYGAAVVSCPEKSIRVYSD
jgi:hypothetical protein